MAVDFSLLPDDKVEEVSAPSRRLWSVVYVVLAAAIAIAVVLLWPTEGAVESWKFWVGVVLFPLGIPLWIVLRRFSVYEGRRLDAQMQAEVAHDYRERVFAAASRPMYLLGAAFRFSAEDKQNTSACILAREESLASVDTPLGDSLRARWLDFPSMREGDGMRDDTERQMDLARWVFNDLLAKLSPTLRGLPRSEEVEVLLRVSSTLKRDVVKAVWADCWKRQIRHAMHIATEEAPQGLRCIDKWLDRMIQGSGHHPRLVVAVQMHRIHTESPPAGTAEAGAAVLLVPDVFTTKHGTPPRIRVHRPVSGSIDMSGDALKHALKWGRASGKRVSRAWRTSGHNPQSGGWQEPARQLDLNPSVTNLDDTVGYAGAAAPWLALACAAQALADDADTHLILSDDGDIVDAAVVTSDPDLNLPSEPIRN